MDGSTHIEHEFRLTPRMAILLVSIFTGCLWAVAILAPYWLL